MFNPDKDWESVFGKDKDAAGGPRKNYPPFWQPKIGDHLTGMLTRINTSTKTGKQFYVIATESEDGKTGRLITLPGTIAVYAAFGKAKDLHGETNVGIGSIVYIKYHGLKMSQKNPGRKFQNYECYFSSSVDATAFFEEKGFVEKDDDGEVVVVGYRGEINDEDVKIAAASKAEWEKRKAAGESYESPAEKKDAEDEKKAEEKAEVKKEAEKKTEKKEDKKKKSKKEKESTKAAQAVIDEVSKLAVIFEGIEMSRVEGILAERGLDIDAKMFVEMAGLTIVDGDDGPKAVVK